VKREDRGGISGRFRKSGLNLADTRMQQSVVPEEMETSKSGQRNNLNSIRGLGHTVLATEDSMPPHINLMNSTAEFNSP
jgi:hypothetical protein